MRFARSRLLLASALVLLVLCGTVAKATAGASLALEPAGTITATSLGSVTFEAGRMVITCPMTLTGRLAAGPIETAGDELGRVEGVRWSRCTGGELTAVLGLSWRLNFTARLGTWPESVTGVSFDIAEAQFSATIGILRCLYRGNLGTLMGATLVREATETYELGLASVSALRIPLSSGAGCAETASMRATFQVAPQQRARQPDIGILRVEPVLALPINEPNTTGDFTLSNFAAEGNRSIVIRDIRFVGGNAANFRINSENCRVTPSPLTAGGVNTCTITVGIEMPRPRRSNLRITYENGLDNTTDLIRDVIVRAPSPA